MSLVEPGDQIEIVAARVGTDRDRRLKIPHRSPLCGHLGAAEERREPAVLPEERAAGVVALRVAQNDVGRQVLVLGPERVTDPRPKRRPPGKDLPGV